ncbi:Cyanovirin-N [Dichomitus squalens]|uniref:Cyanovirin-N n=1 Tax=Dichomitus squalens TaxID=114155 RepID=A0A4V6MVZ9_9APHY|nr:Cyanovirin-N [Dichomitus squalens]TBU47169.1 Cyanovirin-N [Dichomitus squalens]
MTFTLTSRNISVADGHTLLAECRTCAGAWSHSSLDLDQYIGNWDGSFHINSSRGYSASSTNVRIEGGTLYAHLRREDGSLAPGAINLDVWVANINGELRFGQIGEHLVKSCAAMMLDGTVLRALCLGTDGKFHASSIQLNDHYSNRDGCFEPGGSFRSTARNLRLVIQGHEVFLHANLLDYDGVWKATQVDLAICILNKEGKLVFEKRDGWFDRDGAIATSGYVVGGPYWLTENNEWARRDCALCLNSTIVTVGICLGICIGGRIGAATAAGLLTPVGTLVEMEVRKWIKDDKLKAQFEEATIGRYCYDTLQKMLAPGAGAYLGAFFESSFSLPLMSRIASEDLYKVLGDDIKSTVDLASYMFLKKTMDALKAGILPKEWSEAEEKVAPITEQGAL